jgi:hypothetical protein
MGLKEQMFCGYIVFLRETEKDREQFEQKVIKAADDYLFGKGIS